MKSNHRKKFYLKKSFQRYSWENQKIFERHVCLVRSQTEDNLWGWPALHRSSSWKCCLEAFLWFSPEAWLSALLWEIGFASKGAVRIWDPGAESHRSVWMSSASRSTSSLSHVLEAPTLKSFILTPWNQPCPILQKYVQEKELHLRWRKNTPLGQQRFPNFII